MAEMKMPEMITLTIGGTTYEIVDELARETIKNLKVDETRVKEIVEDCLDDAGVEKFATKDEVEAKADDVLFPEDYRVGADFGGFRAGDRLQGLPLKEIIVKLLDATEKENMVEKITSNEIPMLSGSSNGVEATTFSVITLTPEQATVAPTTSGFYQIVADGVVTQSGYQLFTESTGRSNYAIAIPEGATILGVYMWDALTQSWLAYSPVFTKTGTTTDGGYTYEIYESDDSSSGEVLRFEIE